MSSDQQFIDSYMREGRIRQWFARLEHQQAISCETAIRYWDALTTERYRQFMRLYQSLPVFRTYVDAERASTAVRDAARDAVVATMLSSTEEVGCMGVILYSRHDIVVLHTPSAARMCCVNIIQCATTTAGWRSSSTRQTWGAGAGEICQRPQGLRW